MNNRFEASVWRPVLEREFVRISRGLVDERHGQIQLFNGLRAVVVWSFRALCLEKACAFNDNNGV